MGYGMIVIHVDYSDAAPEERAAVESTLNALRSENVLVTSSNAEDDIDQVKAVLLDYLAERKMAENELFGERDLAWLASRDVLNPAQKPLMNTAFERLCEEGILLFDANARGMRLTKAGLKHLYSR